MGALSELICNAGADASLAFRERVYRRGEQGELARDVLALANAPAIGGRLLVLGVRDTPDERSFPGISERSWASFRDALPSFLATAIEPALRLAFESVRIGDALIGVVRLGSCDDPPYLLARRLSATMPAGVGWIRRGTHARRLLRRHLQDIFAARFTRDEPGEIVVGFPGELPRDELELAAIPLDTLPSDLAAKRIERKLEAKRVAKSILGRTDSRIARLVHAQVAGVAVPYREQGTKTLRIMLDKVPGEEAAADLHHRYEQRAHRLNLMLLNLGDQAHKDLVLTLKFPRIEGFDVAPRVCAAPGAYNPRHRLYPRVDHGPRTIAVQAAGLRIPRRGSIEAFIEPLRVVLREEIRGGMIRVAYSLHGPTLASPLKGRLKLLVSGSTRAV